VNLWVRTFDLPAKPFYLDWKCVLVYFIGIAKISNNEIVAAQAVPCNVALLFDIASPIAIYTT